MSYAPAYTTRFHSLDDTLWEIVIYIEGFEGTPTEISLEADEPCVIEWQETQKTDVVQSSTCTLRVSNESDRQMVQLMNRPNAVVLVSRDGKPYWFGHLDDAVYEEPYSYLDGYATDLIFSDFGILNRIPFGLTGKQSVGAIVRDCLDSIGYGNGATINLYTSLLEPKTQQPVTLDMLYVNADRFEAGDDSWGATTTKREVLEEILRPLGLRIMQKYGQIHIYDIEYLRDHDNLSDYVAWKGTDACLRGSETFCQYEVAFEPDALETLAESGLDYDDPEAVWNDSEQHFALSHIEDEFMATNKVGFYVESRRFLSGALPMFATAGARYFRTRAVFTDSNDVGIAWRIACKKVTGYGTTPLLPGISIPVVGDCVLVDHRPARGLSETEPVFSICSGYLPVAPDRGKYQLKVSLGFLLSFRDNPLDSPSDEWVEQQAWYLDSYHECEWRAQNLFALMLPVKLELVDEQGNVLMHYENASATDVLVFPFGHPADMARVSPHGIGNGQWKQGAASWSDMFLAYYKDYDPDDDDRDPLVAQGWVANRIALSYPAESKGTLYAVRADGEYLPLPPMAGRLRLTVGSGVFPFPSLDHPGSISPFYFNFAWQLYRNPEISIVKANRKDDGIDTDTLYERYAFGNTDALGETDKTGTWRKGVAPSARGLLFDASGNVWEKFARNGTELTLQQHRIRSLLDQFSSVQPVLSGTAELDIQFCAKRDNSTTGIFLVTALRQDLHEDLEEVTMACIGGHEEPGGGQGGGIQPEPPYQASWSSPLCAEEEAPFAFLWGNPICTQKPGPYEAAWSNPLCTQRYQYDLDWETMQEET